MHGMGMQSTGITVINTANETMLDLHSDADAILAEEVTPAVFYDN